MIPSHAHTSAAYTRCPYRAAETPDTTKGVAYPGVRVVAPLPDAAERREIRSISAALNLTAALSDFSTAFSCSPFSSLFGVLRSQHRRHSFWTSLFGRTWALTHGEIQDVLYYQFQRYGFYLSATHLEYLSVLPFPSRPNCWRHHHHRIMIASLSRHPPSAVKHRAQLIIIITFSTRPTFFISQNLPLPQPNTDTGCLCSQPVT